MNGNNKMKITVKKNKLKLTKSKQTYTHTTKRKLSKKIDKITIVKRHITYDICEKFIFQNIRKQKKKMYDKN